MWEALHQSYPFSPSGSVWRGGELAKPWWNMHTWSASPKLPLCLSGKSLWRSSKWPEKMKGTGKLRERELGSWRVMRVLKVEREILNKIGECLFYRQRRACLPCPSCALHTPSVFDIPCGLIRMSWVGPILRLTTRLVFRLLGSTKIQPSKISFISPKSHQFLIRNCQLNTKSFS